MDRKRRGGSPKRSVSKSSSTHSSPTRARPLSKMRNVIRKAGRESRQSVESSMETAASPGPYTATIVRPAASPVNNNAVLAQPSNPAVFSAIPNREIDGLEKILEKLSVEDREEMHRILYGRLPERAQYEGSLEADAAVQPMELKVPTCAPVDKVVPRHSPLSHRAFFSTVMQRLQEETELSPRLLLSALTEVVEEKERDDAKKAEEEKKRVEEEAKKAAQSSALPDCGVCHSPNPEARTVFSTCGHVACLKCAEGAAARGPRLECPYCAAPTTYMRIFEREQVTKIVEPQLKSEVGGVVRESNEAVEKNDEDARDGVKTVDGEEKKGNWLGCCALGTGRLTN